MCRGGRTCKCYHLYSAGDVLRQLLQRTRRLGCATVAPRCAHGSSRSRCRALRRFCAGKGRLRQDGRAADAGDIARRSREPPRKYQAGKQERHAECAGTTPGGPDRHERQRRKALCQQASRIEALRLPRRQRNDRRGRQRGPPRPDSPACHRRSLRLRRPTGRPARRLPSAPGQNQPAGRVPGRLTRCSLASCPERRCPHREEP